MSIKHWASSFTATIVLCLTGCASDDGPSEGTISDSTHYKTVKVAVEGVYSIEEDGFRNVNYLVTWDGQRVIAEDALARTHCDVGDELSMIVDWIDLPSKRPGERVKTLSFLALKCDTPVKKD